MMNLSAKKPAEFTDLLIAVDVSWKVVRLFYSLGIAKVSENAIMIYNSQFKDNDRFKLQKYMEGTV